MADEVFGLTARAEKIVSDMAAQFLRQHPQSDRRTRRVFPRTAQANDSIITGGDCNCCPDCICPNESDIIDDCEAVPCLVNEYSIIGNFPWGNNNNTLAHDAGCDFLGTSFNITVCEGTALEHDYGSHQWDLTVAAGMHDSELHLTGELDLTYVSAAFFHPYCGNEFVLKPSCDDSSLMKGIPRKICVMPPGEACEACEPYGVGIPCCPSTPSVLYSVLTAASCPKLNGVATTLLFDAIYSGWYRWTGEMSVGPSTPDFCDLPFTFYYEVNDSCESRMYIKDSLGATVWGDDSSGGSLAHDCPFASTTSVYTGSNNVPACLSSAMTPTCTGTMEATVSTTP
jgi:hypothetical protein